MDSTTGLLYRNTLQRRIQNIHVIFTMHTTVLKHFFRIVASVFVLTITADRLGLRRASTIYRKWQKYCVS